MNIRAFAFLLAVSVAGCSAPPTQIEGAFVPNARSAVSARSVNLTLVLDNVPKALRSVNVRATNVKSGMLVNTVVEVDGRSCPVAKAKISCSVKIGANEGLNDVDVQGYDAKDLHGTELFHTAMAGALAKNATVHVPNGIYVRKFSVGGSPTGSVTRGVAGTTPMWFMGEATGFYAGEVGPTGVFVQHALPQNDVYPSLAAGKTRMWTVAGYTTTPALDAIAPAGKITVYPATLDTSCNNRNHPTSVATGSDGKEWFLEFTACGGGGAVGSIDDQGSIADYDLPVDKGGGQIYTLGVGQHLIVAGKDGSLYAFANRCQLSGGYCQQTESIPTVLKISTGGGIAPIFTQALSACGGGYVAAGGDGSVWLLRPCVPPNVTRYQNTIVRITPAGHLTYYYAGYSYANDFAEGPDGNVYATNQGGVIRFVTQGNVGQWQEFQIAQCAWTNSAGAGADGYLYVSAGPQPYCTHGYLDRVALP